MSAGSSSDAGYDETVTAAPRADSPNAPIIRAPKPADIPARLGRYVVLRLLGQGGMGAVYEADDPELGRHVAIKVLRADRGDPRLAASLRREAQALARLVHPNVVTVHDVGVADEQVFVVMQLVDGQAIDSWLRARNAGVAEIVARFCDAGRGLAAAHAAAMVHCDFKPSNVLVDREGVARVGDFGLARLARDAPAVGPSSVPASELETAAGGGAGTVSVVAGTPAYMAPEQLAGAATAASDQFAFCVALWEVLAGERPFADGFDVGGDHRATRGVRREMPRRARVPGRVTRALERGLDPTPSARFPSMTALLAALAPPTRRHLVIAGAVIGAIAITGGVIAATRGSDDPTVARAIEIPLDAGPPGLPDLPAAHPLTDLGREVCAYAPTIDAGGMVVFDRTEGDAVDLYRVPLAGGTVERLTSAPTTWEWRAHAGRRPGEVIHVVHDPHRRSDGSIAWLDLATGADTTVARVFAQDAISVGDAIYYTPFEGTEIRRITAAGDETYAIAPAGAVFSQLAASPRGDRFAAVGGRAGQLCVIDAVTAAVDCVVEEAVPVRPAFGADGAAIYYAAIDGIHRRDLATGDDVLIAPDARTPGGLAVAPDGSALVYSECGASSPILDASVTPPVVVIDDPSANDLAVGVGGEIAWTHLDHGVRVLMVRTASGQTIQATRVNLGPVEAAAFSPDGKQIAFRVLGANAGIHLAAPELGTVSERLTVGDRDYKPTWVGDDRIAFTRMDDQNRPSIYVMGVDGGPARQVTSASRMILGVRGHDLLVAGMKNVYWLDVDTGKERDGPRLSGLAPTRAATSPDGRWLLYQTGTGEDLWRSSTEPGAEFERLPSFAGGQTLGQAAITDDGHVLVAPQSWAGDLVILPARAGSRF